MELSVCLVSIYFPALLTFYRFGPKVLSVPHLPPAQRRYYGNLLPLLDIISTSLTYPCLAEVIIKVPEMAESISEGTLKQWSKSVGDYVEQDEEIATIETDKIDVSVNAPDTGTLKELMAKEEDTVTVGQEIAKMDSGAAPEGGKQGTGKSESKEPAPKEQQTSSQPSSNQERGATAQSTAERPQHPTGDRKPQQQKDEATQHTPQQDTKPSPREQPKADSTKVQSGGETATGIREERRV